MKKASVLLVLIATLLFNNSFGQVTEKGGASSPTSTSTDKKDKSDRNDKVKDNVSGDAAAMAREWTQKMDEVVNLDASQEKKVMETNLRYANRLEDLKAKYKAMDNPNADAAKAEKDELTKQRFKEYSEILSKEQMRKFKEYRDSHKDGDGKGDKADKKGDAKEKYENASPEEKERMKEEMKDKKDKKND
ncbi:MAG: hypothetical protein ACHQFW_04500 [Chitinophagales bacterium]